MPKRPYSEVECEDSRLQSKIHVGAKEVNLGVSSVSKMKAVFDRTLNMLFQGSKKKKNITHNPSLAGHGDKAATKYCQMTLTPNCQISSVLGDYHSKIRPASILFDKCPTCFSVVGAMHDFCQFCEKAVCDGCLKACCVCYGEFCTKCSMKVYTKEDSQICFSCASERKCS